MRGAVLLTTVILLAGCGSSPKTHYFTLSRVPGGQERTASIGTPVTVAAVHVPQSLDRSEMVRTTGDNTVEISDQDRWTAPLGEIARSVLSEDLAERLPRDEVVVPDAPAPPHTTQIVVSLAEFGLDPGGKVVLVGSWSLLDGDRGKLLLRRDVALQTAAKGLGGSGEAAAMSELLGELAGDIVKALSGRQRA
jgi:uncharacterized lipoprotein YmbA